MRNAKDKYPNTTVGSDGYLHITTPFPGIALPDAGYKKQQFNIKKLNFIQN